MDEPREGSRSIRRRDLPAVVQRAAELAAIDDDVSEELSEDEVVRIAAELGLPARHVKAALYEGARAEPEPTFLDRQFGTPRIMTTRSIPFDVERARRAIEDYLVSSEYLCVVRRQGSVVTFEPAPDAVSKLSRAFKRGASHVLASAQVVEVSVRPLEEGWSHVRLRAVFKDERKGHVAGAIVGGTLLGIPIGIVSGALGGALSHEAAIAIVSGSIATVGSGTAIFFGILASMRNRYKQWRERTLMQTEGALDRLEKGQDMRRPAPAWFKKLQDKLSSLDI